MKFFPVNWDDDLFEESPVRNKLTRREKWENHHIFLQKRAKHPLDLPIEKMRGLQQSDSSLAAIHKTISREASTAGVGFFDKDEVL